MDRRADETFAGYRVRRALENKRVKEHLEGTVVAYGPQYSRGQRRALIRRELPADVAKVVGEIARRSSDLSREQLSMVYLTEPEEKRGEAADKLRGLLVRMKRAETAGENG